MTALSPYTRWATVADRAKLGWLLTVLKLASESKLWEASVHNFKNSCSFRHFPKNCTSTRKAVPTTC
jgi:hypothetical protein